MYTKEEKLNIGRRIYNAEINKNQAAEIYGICSDSARNYMRLYRDYNHLPPKPPKQTSVVSKTLIHVPEVNTLMDYEAMSKEELIQELIKSRITQARLKKGYEVRGDGPDKEFIPIDSRNIR